MARGPGVVAGELVLRRAGAHFEIISNGVFLMDTRDGTSERELVRASLAALPAGRTGVRVLIGGLGVGFSARAALEDRRVAHVRVIEVEPEVIAWHSGPLGAVAGHLTADPRCELTRADLLRWLATVGDTARFDVICLDIDNGPGWTVNDGNAQLYRPATLRRLRRLLTDGGVVAFWSAMRAPDFAALLAAQFAEVRTIEVPARRGEPDVIYLARP
ncbi:spermidine synthase [Halostreptopolyspora alba]|uniref:Spermidine synthase n=1 Tax=Halostreptopolyspora alba TaxID=2487137 RepID=A0A3N0E5C9_9ACTN|nr:spermidine synthase [Nocardiopsaceae bacterium YIM 96095]